MMNVFVAIARIQIFLGILVPVMLASPGGKKLGEECIPGMCAALNSNCKWNGSFFKCMCKDKFMAVNATHCGHTMSNIEEQKCRECLERDSLCLDFDNDGLTDECWCPKNETCGGGNAKSKDSKGNAKSSKNVELSMALLDTGSNRIIQDGNSVYLGDQVVIDIKPNKKENGIVLSVENCSILTSSSSSSEEGIGEKTDLIKKGCSIQNDLYPISLSFHSVEDTHLESNTFEIAKLKSSSAVIVISCWVQICWQRSKCLVHSCHDRLAAAATGRKKAGGMASSRGTLDSSSPSTQDYTFREASIRVSIEDPYGSQQYGDMFQSGGGKSSKDQSNVIELDFKTKPFSGLIKSFMVSTITVVFAIFVAAVSILTYRACLRDQLMHQAYDAPVSICQTSENSCKYDINGRNVDESFFQSNGEQLTAQSHNPRW